MTAAPETPPKSKAWWKTVGKVAVDFLVSPQARRYEIALALGLFEAVKAGLTGHA